MTGPALRRALIGLALVPAAAAAIGACGLGPGARAHNVRLLVTDDFGNRTIRDISAPRQAGEETVMRLVARNASLTTRFGGGFVQSIDGRAGGHSGGQPVDWFYYVNGLEARQGAAATAVHDGDRVWWDRHDWAATLTIPAVVGAFPEPFEQAARSHLPVRLACAWPDASCTAVRGALRAAGIGVVTSSLASSTGSSGPKVLVGPWRQLRTERTARTLELGPSISGVYVRPAPTGRTLTVLAPDGRSARVLGSTSGLIAATRIGNGPPEWVVSGTDEDGVLSAARMVSARALQGRFAVAVSGGRAWPAPQVGR